MLDDVVESEPFAPPVTVTSAVAIRPSDLEAVVPHGHRSAVWAVSSHRPTGGVKSRSGAPLSLRSSLGGALS